jgi:hypothetical protein
MKEGLFAFPLNTHIRNARMKSASELFGYVNVNARVWRNECEMTVGNTSETFDQGTARLE